MKILFSSDYHPIIHLPSGDYGGHHLTFSRRASDWGKSGLKKRWHHVIESIKVMREARDYDVLILSSVGIEAFFVGRWKGFFCPHTPVVCFDFLMPSDERFLRFTRRWLRGIDHFVCLRVGDIATFKRRFGILTRKCSFVHFPIDAQNQAATEDEGYIYSAGVAHRDWEMLIKALSTLPYSALLSFDGDFAIPEHAQNRITILPAQNTEDGRRLLQKARLVVMPLRDTFLPSGPLVLLDAMSMSKPTVVTDVNGTRDYVSDGETALVVPPGDSEAMAGAIQKLMEDDALRHKIARQAREDVCKRFTVENFLDKILPVCEKVAAAKRRYSQ